MNLRALQTLVAAVEAGGFQAAADRLNLTQSAVSMQIKALEGEFAVRLFDRTTRPPTPTVAGRSAAVRARAVLAALAQFEAGARAPDGGDGGLGGVLHLGAIPTATTGFLPDALARLAADHPGLQARVESGLTDALLARVATGELDAALVTDGGETPPKSLDLHVLREEALVVVARTGPADGRADSALAAAPLIRFNRQTGVGRIIDRRLRADGVAPRDAMELDSIEAILAMVSRGLGAAVVPEDSLTGAAATGLWSAPYPGLSRRVSLATRRGGAEDRAVAALLATLAKAART
ncbi:MAG: LysR family transcriptional regulator [Marivibrio sp.]|uniref:LysR family transcriptional regulator n=1 Tax=Marivibrio sp. TaxID=2039719 RepID=UPI0032EE2DF2